MIPLTIPNTITLLRFPLGILAGLCYYFDPNSWTGPLFLVMAGLTDLADGFAARRLDSSSRYGTRLDHLADATAYSAVALAWIAAGITQHSIEIGVLLAAVLFVANFLVNPLAYPPNDDSQVLLRKMASFCAFLACLGLLTGTFMFKPWPLFSSGLALLFVYKMHRVHFNIKKRQVLRVT